MGNSLRPYFISLALRKVVLRIIIISSLSSSLIGVTCRVLYHGNDPIFALYDYLHLGNIFAGLSIFPFLVFLHHIIRLWPRKKWTVKCEYICSIIELAFVTGYLIIETYLFWLWFTDIYPFLLASPELAAPIILLSTAAFLWLSVVASLVVMTLDLRRTKYRTVMFTYDFMENHDDTVEMWRRLGIGRWSLVFGENIFRRRFGMDRGVVRGLRAGISFLSLLAIVAFAIQVLIVQPIQQQPVFQIMQAADPGRYGVGNVTMALSLVTTVPMTEGGARYFDDLDMNVTWQPESRHVLCDPFTMTSVTAWPSRPISLASATCQVETPFAEFAPDSLIITINYARAFERHASIPSLRTGVYLAFSNTVERSEHYDLYDHKVLRNYGSSGIISTQLHPGFHLFGTTFYSFRDTYTNSRNSAFGIPRFDRSLIANVQAIIPDPEFTNLPSDNTTATLRLTYQADWGIFQTRYEVQREQSSNTVLGGFALLGGAWTFVSGGFATVFGCQLLLVLFGIKPLSIYGLVHLFQRRRSLADGGYTLSVEEQSRTIAVLREHLLDDDNGKSAGAGEGGEENDKDEEARRVDGGNALATGEQSGRNDTLQIPLRDDDKGNTEASEASEDCRNRDVELRLLDSTIPRL